MGKALQIRQKAADSPQGLTARRWPALLALARKAAGPYGEDVAAWLAVPEAQAEPCLLELAQCLSRLTMRNVDDLAPLTLASGQPVAGGEYTIKSGGYYRINIVADGSQELALSGGDFFRAIWINEIVIGDTEIRPMGVHSIEFDADGTAVLSFVAVLPGRYTLSVPGSSGDSLQAVFNIQ